jgi:peptidyl-prolyl cis-trans isomerase D
MFDAIRSRHRTFTFVLMLVIVVSFILTGAYGYRQFMAADSSIARVGPEHISQQDLDVAMRERLARMAQMLGANFDARAFDTPQARAATLDSLLSERALKLEVQRSRLAVSDRKLQDVIGSTKAFQQEGRFDYNTYKTLLAAQGMNEHAFEADVRSDLARQTLIDAVGDSAVLPKTVSDRLWQLQHEKREVRELAFRPESYLAKADIGEDAVKADYERNKARYMTPETVHAEYLVLRAADLASQVTVTPEEVRAFYDHNPQRWGQAERRRASHILITSGAGGSAPDKAQARKLAESVLAKVRANPADFAKLAKEFSKDPGSAQKGGDLGWFGRGMMVKPFEDAAFSLKDGDTSGLVETEFGLHIIRVTGLEAAHTKTFDEVKSQIEDELRQKAAEKRFSEVAEQFSNFVYEQADGLKPAAEKFKIALHEVDGLTRKGAPQGEASGLFTPAVLEALFAPDSLGKRKNTKAVEIGGNALLSARVLDYHASVPMPLETVAANIKAALQRQAASDMAKKAGEARMAELQKSPGDDGFAPSVWVGRDEAQQLPPVAVTSVMRLSASQLPTYVGVEGGDGGYLVLHVLSVKAAEPPAADASAGASRQWMQALSSTDELSYVQGLRQRFGAKVVRTDLTSTSGKGEQDSGN